ncbi:MAG TPA: hypothetical protein ENN80_06645 [Candidatus Hydrogenedentes bacterium]|nr:hypothetical protein [Candidatus Hydrogenedentota bacterium]
MKVCFVVSQLFAHGKYGGFGSLTRTLGKALATRGIEVFAVVPRRSGQPEREEMDGITVLAYSRVRWSASLACFRACDCDVYHSEEPSMATVYAQKAMPGRVHLVTAQDPRNARDWRTEFRYQPLRKKPGFIPAMLYETNPLITRAVRTCTRCYTQARFVADKARRLYGLDYTPEFLPNGVTLPDAAPAKAEHPTVVFLSRWDRRKRIEQFMALAEQFPDVRFIALGKAHDARYDATIRRRYAHLPQLDMPGLVDQFSGASLSDYLGPAWIMCNTAARECLPVAFLEAAAHGCSILSYVNPDGFASEMGYHARTDEDLEAGLRWLLEGDHWRRQGERGRAYVAEHHALDHVVDQHIAVYERHLREQIRKRNA